MANDQLHVELEKAKEVMRGALHLYRASTHGDRETRAKEAVRDAELIAKEAFRHVDSIIAHGPITKSQ